MTQREQLEGLLNAIPQYADMRVEYRRGQGYFARNSLQLLYFQTFAIGRRFCDQCKTTGRGVMSDLRKR